VGYAAPEILGGGAFDGMAADVFSLGVCLYAMFRGEPPVADTRKFRAARLNFEGIEPEVAELIVLMTVDPPSARPSVAEVRGHRAFAGLSSRPRGAAAFEVGAPIVEVNGTIVSRLADVMESDAEEITRRLRDGGVNQEKVLYTLAKMSPDFKIVEEEVSPEKVRLSKSLPPQNTLSAVCPFCREDYWAKEVPGHPGEVASIIVRKMLAQRFVVSMTRSGSREFVLNQAGEDIALDVDVCPGEAPGKSIVVMRSKEGPGLPVLSEMQDFIEHRFAARVR
jgi:hypothetical protein